MLAPEAAAGELERTVKDLGFHGVLVNGATEQSGTKKSGALWQPRPGKPIL